MVVTVKSLGLNGVSGYGVEVECLLSGGLPAFDVVGLPDTAVRESRERVRGAIKSCGARFPVSRITVNLAPAGQKKEGTVYDLPMFVGILAAAEALPVPKGDVAFLGELSLTGALRAVSGVLPMALAAKALGITTLYVPAPNAAEATLAQDMTVYGIKDVGELIDHLIGRNPIAPASAWEPTASSADLPDLADVMGQELVRRALEVAASGGHNLLFTGFPGAGKSMLAKRLPSILPDMTREEALEVSGIWSVAGMADPNEPLLLRRPFRSPHHTASAPALVGGGASLRPGEISLAHNGVLFLDELPEFRRDVLEAMRQPLEDGEVTIARATGSLRLPARFQLICAMNPCRCGWHGHPSGKCNCSDRDVAKYVEKISGPLLDRMDLHVHVPTVEYQAMQRKTAAESSAVVKERVDGARAAQKIRYQGTKCTCNAQMPVSMLPEYCALDGICQALMEKMCTQKGLSARSHDRVLRVARTIADLDGGATIELHHLSEALSYHNSDILKG
ncbi:YifB family Mg chelatase-like AAA ATPase [Bengtsoniella intestinalis]|uniref:YifB family Mg chelatase-like AAA ATPase n=1 Tax=Bengtsoniella intestinalis TaxID=3073143 RepID=UPI00391F3E8A